MCHYRQAIYLRLNKNQFWYCHGLLLLYNLVSAADVQMGVCALRALVLNALDHKLVMTSGPYQGVVILVMEADSLQDWKY